MTRRDLVAGLLGAIVVALAMLMSISGPFDGASVAAVVKEIVAAGDEPHQTALKGDEG